MNELKILVIGASGVIGSQILERFEDNNIFATYYKNKLEQKNSFFLDITNKEQVQNKISEIQPDIVFHTTAITNVDLCEQNCELAELVNCIGTENIVDGCKSTNSKIVYVSTSAVYDGTKKEYYENDETSPKSIYGKTKSDGEKIIQKSGLPYLILRTDQPYFWKKKWHHTNSVLRVIESLTQQKRFKEIIDWYNSPTYIPDFVNASFQLIKNNKNGIYHIVGEDFLSRYEFAKIIAKIFSLDESLLIPISEKMLHLPAKRSNTKLNNEKIFKETGVKMKGVEEGLKEMLHNK